MKPYKTYIAAWAVLLVLTVLTWQVSLIHLGVFNVVVALAIASVKASLVALFFMHLKDEKVVVWAFALFPLFFLTLIIFGTLSDVLFR